MDITNSVIIVTGASEGIGRATAKLLASHGARVVLAARNADKLNALATELPSSLAVPTDMRKPEDIKLIQQTLEKFGRVDVLVNNAGQGIYGPVESINVDDYANVVELNVYGVLRAMQEVIPIMRKQGSGAIVNVSSAVSRMYIPGLAAYASTKYALNALSFTARQELEQDHIIVSSVLPKMTATDFGKNSIGPRPDWSGRSAPEVDSPEKVAEKIEEIIRTGAAEIAL
jgi:short-subunit dehydrogenase